MSTTRLLVARRGHLRGHGGAHGGGTVALATTLTRQTSIFYTLASAYKVVLCARVQEPNAGDAKTGYDAAGAAGGFGGVFGAFARGWRR